MFGTNMGLLQDFHTSVVSQTAPENSLIFKVMNQDVGTAVLAGNDTFLTENITEDRKKFITQSKHMIF